MMKLTSGPHYMITGHHLGAPGASSFFFANNDDSCVLGDSKEWEILILNIYTPPESFGFRFLFLFAHCQQLLATSAFVCFGGKMGSC